MPYSQDTLYLVSGPYRVEKKEQLATAEYWAKCENEIKECIGTCELSHEEALKYVEQVLLEIEYECGYDTVKSQNDIGRMVTAEIIVSKILLKDVRQNVFETVDIAFLLAEIFRKKKDNI